MKVAEFRDLVDEVYCQVNSFKSATEPERLNELARVRASLNELVGCRWPTRLTDRDRDKANAVIRMTHACFADAGSTC